MQCSDGESTRFVTYLSCFCSTKSPFTSEGGLALKQWKRGDQISILPADKGKATVIMDRSTFETKMELSERGTYLVVNKDPSASSQRKKMPYFWN